MSFNPFNNEKIRSTVPFFIENLYFLHYFYSISLNREVSRISLDFESKNPC